MPCLQVQVESKFVEVAEWVRYLQRISAHINKACILTVRGTNAMLAKTQKVTLLPCLQVQVETKMAILLPCLLVQIVQFSNNKYNPINISKDSVIRKVFLLFVPQWLSSKGCFKKHNVQLCFLKQPQKFAQAFYFTRRGQR